MNWFIFSSIGRYCWNRRRKEGLTNIEKKIGRLIKTTYVDKGKKRFLCAPCLFPMHYHSILN